MGRDEGQQSEGQPRKESALKEAERKAISEMMSVLGRGARMMRPPHDRRRVSDHGRYVPSAPPAPAGAHDDIVERFNIADLGENVPEDIRRSRGAGACMPAGRGAEWVTISIEKLEAQFQLLKELKATTDERISKLGEEMGELRMLTLEKERRLGDIEKGFGELKETMEQLRPARFTKSLEDKEREISSSAARIEKLEMDSRGLKSRLSDLGDMLGKIRDIENIIRLSKEIEKKLAAVTESKNSVERLSNKIESIYIELNRRMESETRHDMDIEKMKDISKDMTKEIDSIGVRLTDLVKAEDFESRLKDIESKTAEKPELRRLGQVSRAMQDWVYEELTKMDSKISSEVESVQKLKDKISKITWLLGALEKQHSDGHVSDSVYSEVKEKNLAELEKLNRMLKEVSGIKTFDEFSTGRAPAEAARAQAAQPPAAEPKAATAKPQETAKATVETPEKSESKTAIPEGAERLPPARNEGEMTTEKATEEQTKIYLVQLQGWNQLLKTPRLSNISKRERQLMEFLYLSKAINRSRALSIAELAKSIYQNEFNHNKLTYVSKIAKRMVRKGLLVGEREGRTTYVFVNEPAIMQAPGAPAPPAAAAAEGQGVKAAEEAAAAAQQAALPAEGGKPEKSAEQAAPKEAPKEAEKKAGHRAKHAKEKGGRGKGGKPKRKAKAGSGEV